jgi:protein TonB
MTHQEDARVSDELAEQATRDFVRVRFQIAADGSFSVVLRGSTGSGEVDARVLEAARRWRWKPALRDGEPVSSTETIRFRLKR